MNEKSTDNIIFNIWFAYIIFYVCFKHLFINDNFLYLIMGCLFIIIIFKELCRKIKIKLYQEWILYMFLIIDMFISIFYAINILDGIKFFAVFLGFFGISFYFSQFSGWQKLFYKWIKIGCMLHLLFTFFSVFFIDQSLEITKYFLSSEAQQWTIRWAKEFHHYAGISGQTGTNAFFFSLLIGVFTAEWCSFRNKHISTIFLLCLSWCGLFLTGKKGLIIASLISTLAVYWNSIKKIDKKKRIVVFISIAGILFSIVCVICHRQIYNLFYVSVISRFRIMDGMITAIREEPLWGNGLNSVSYFTYDSHLGHNIYMQMWVEQGIIGVILLIITLGYSLILTYRKNRKIILSGGHIQISNYFSLFMQVFVIIYGFFGNPIYDYNIIIVFFMAIASAIPIPNYTSKNITIQSS